MERTHLRRFIGSSRKRLAQVVSFAFPTGIRWKDGRPSPVVDQVFPVNEFGQLLDDLPEGEPLDDTEKEAIACMEKLVASSWQGKGPDSDMS
jgi:hypothetical protein